MREKFTAATRSRVTPARPPLIRLWSGPQPPSVYVLRAAYGGCADLTVRTALRVSFCADNTAEDVDALLAGVRDGLKELQHI